MSARAVFRILLCLAIANWFVVKITSLHPGRNCLDREIVCILPPRLADLAKLDGNVGSLMEFRTTAASEARRLGIFAGRQCAG